MKTKFIFLNLLFFAVFAATFTSCQSEDVQTTDETVITASQDGAQAMQISDGITAESDNYIALLDNLGYKLAASKTSSMNVTAYPNITIDKPDSVNFPKIITIDFGTSGFTTARGDVIKGKLVITVTGRMFVKNTSRTFVFTAFSVNDNVVSGTKTVTYMGLNTINNPYWNITANLAFNLSDGRTITWQSQRTRERIDNNGTPLVFSDDKYSLKGSANGVNSKGNNYSISIDNNNPLIFFANYPYFVKGNADIAVNSKQVNIDFGDGTKDDLATITYNGTTKQIHLKK